ncbi:MAG: DoxX family protein [Planctomycetota bacterium]
MKQNASLLQTDLALLALRLMAGSVFAFHGAQKLFGLFGGYGVAGTAGWMESIGIPLPTVSAVLAGGTELVGGLALFAGLGQRLLAVPLTFTMLVAAFTAHSGFNAATGGMEYPLTLAVLAAALGLLGPGRLSLARAASGTGAEAVVPQGSGC